METVTYARRGDRELLADVYRPEGPPKAAVILLHGGGWRVGSKEAIASSAQALVNLGFLALPVQYRLLGEAAWPAQIQDVRSAVRWLRHNCKSFGVGPDKIAVEGFSAGAHLALLVAGTSHIAGYSATDDPDEDDSVAGVVAFFSPIEFRIGAVAAAGESEASRLLQDITSPAEAANASPITHIGDRFPPTCLLHGTDDQIVSSITSQRVFDRLRTAGVAADLHLFAGHTHEFSALPSMLGHVQGIAASFLERHVVDREFHVQENLALNPFAGGRRP